MDIYALHAQGAVQVVSPDAGDKLIWVDVVRADSDWPERVSQLLGVEIYERHLSDLRNERHPPFYDGSEVYDLLIVRSVEPGSPLESPRTNPIAFLITGTAVVSVRAPGDPVFDLLRERLLSGHRRRPPSPGALLHLLLNEVGDSLLALREPMNAKLVELQSRLLDPEDPFADWHLLMDMRSRFRWLETNLGVQREILERWRGETGVVVFEEGLRVRFNDLDEHFARVERQAGLLESDIETLVQVHFSANSDRTNRVMQFLAVVSVVFLPLNLMAGVFGMNFDAMPLLGSVWGFWVTLAGMAVVGVLVTVWFRLRRWM